MATHSEDDGLPNLQVPTVGMVFKSEDDIREYYREYAHGVGFGVTKRSSRKREGLQYFALVCSRQGDRPSKSVFPSMPTAATNCKAKINVKSSRDGEFEISTVELTHNHELSPGKSCRFRCNKKIDMSARRSLELNDEAGIRMNKNFNTLVVEAGGYEGLSFGQSECRSYIRKFRQLRLGEGDAQALQQYLCRIQQNNKQFYYVMDISEDGQLRNIFWADARSRATYKEFEDVVTFDSTYLTNKYDMPFAPFVGVNHHGHSILLGCALLSNEDTDTYTWLFKCWLDCMSGKAPLGIVIDQRQAMHVAISEVFPCTQHRLCLWHIMKKIPKKIGKHNEYHSIKRTMKRVVYESLREGEFELNWFEMVQKFNLQGNIWLTSLYRCRTMWVPVFLKKYFWAAMSTTQRSESMNAFFDGYVHSKTSLKQFVREFDNALRDKVEKEHQADFMSFSRSLPLVCDLNIEKKFQIVYTHEIMKKVQVEFKGLVYCSAHLVNVDDFTSIYEVSDSVLAKDGQTRNEITLQVQINGMNDTIDCVCSLFQFKGIVCRHMICSMIKHCMNSIPNKYILDRWRKDIKRTHTLIKSSYDDVQHNPQMRRYDELDKLTSSANEIATLNNEKFNLWKDYIIKGKEKILGVVTSIIGDVSCKQVKIRSPEKRRKRGRPPVNRIKSTVETCSKQKNKGKEKEIDLEETHERSSPDYCSQVGEISTTTVSEDRQSFSYSRLLLEQEEPIWNTPWSQESYYKSEP